MPEPRPANEVVVLTAEQMSRTITRIAHEILEKNPGGGDVAVVGIHTRGAFLGARIHKLLCEVGGRSYAAGNLDISFYRDDFDKTGLHPQIKPTRIPFEVDARHIVLVDDVRGAGGREGSKGGRPAAAHPNSLCRATVSRRLAV